MKRNIFNFFVLSLLFMGLFVLSGCGNRNQAEQENFNKKKKEARQAQNIALERIQDEEIKKIIKDFQKEPPSRITSIDKINNKEKAGKLNTKEAVKLRLTALTNPDKLINDYKGEEIKGRSSLNSDTKWILNNWDNLSEEEREEFRPYITPPDEEGSVFYGDDDDLSGLFIKKARAATPDWESLDLAFGGSAKLYYKQKSSWSESRKNEEEEKAIHLEIALEDSWPKFKNLLGTEPNEKVYVYLVKMNDCGEAFMQNKDGVKRCIINIKNDQTKKMLKSSLAHELFHCFQYSLSDKYENLDNDIDWIAEGTAVWSEDYVYPAHNSEHQYLDDYFFSHLDEELVTSKGDWEYGRYLWFYFLSQYYDASYIPKILKKAGNEDIRKATMDSVPEYDLAYQDFAFYNWNYGPFFKYIDTPEFPQGVHPSGVAFDYFNVFDEQENDYPVKLDKGAMKYITYTFDYENGAKYATFTFNDHGDNLSITALTKKSTGWGKESWSTEREKKICLEDEEIGMIVLIIANSDLNNKEDFNYKLKLEKECPKISRGTMILKEKASSEMGQSEVIMESNDILEYDPESDCFDIVERNISCQLSKSTEAMKGTPAYIKNTENGQGSLHETYYQDDDRPSRICFNSYGATFILDPDTDNLSYVDATYTMTANPAWTEKTFCSGSWPTNHVINPDHVGENTIKGSDTVPVGGMFTSGEVEIDYNYILYKDK